MVFKLCLLKSDGSSSVLSTGSRGELSEKWLQDFLFKHPETIPIEEIDPGLAELVPIAREFYTPAGPIDILFVTPRGQIVLVETKLWKNPEARRKVIAQILDYAKEFSQWSYADLQREVSRHHKKSGNHLFELIYSANSTIDEAEFIDHVSHNLQAGRLHLIIAGDGIRSQTAAISSYLRNHINLHFNLSLITIDVYADNEQKIIIPRLHAKTSIIERTVLSFKNSQITVEEEIESSETSEESNYYFEFWSDFLSKIRLDDPEQPFPKASKGQNLYFNLTPSGKAWISLYFAPASGQVGIYFRATKKAQFDEKVFRLLDEHKNEILKILPNGVLWRPNQSSLDMTIIFKKPVKEIYSEEAKADIMKFFLENTNPFVNAFRPFLWDFETESE
ncbi:MAG: DUF4268 domain-containing protein [Oligoflexus sp.]